MLRQWLTLGHHCTELLVAIAHKVARSFLAGPDKTPTPTTTSQQYLGEDAGFRGQHWQPSGREQQPLAGIRGLLASLQKRTKSGDGICVGIGVEGGSVTTAAVTRISPTQCRRGMLVHQLKGLRSSYYSFTLGSPISGALQL